MRENGIRCSRLTGRKYQAQNFSLVTQCHKHELNDYFHFGTGGIKDTLFGRTNCVVPVSSLIRILKMLRKVAKK